MPTALHMLSRPSVVVYTENPSHATSMLRSRRDRAAGRRHPGNREPSRVPACSQITSNTHTCENVCIYRNIGEPALVTQASSGRLRHTNVKIYICKGHECVYIYLSRCVSFAEVQEAQDRVEKTPTVGRHLDRPQIRHCSDMHDASEHAPRSL